MAYKSQPTVTRPANTTAYTAGDVVGGAFKFGGIPSREHLLITLAALGIDVAAIPVGMTSFRYHFYTQTPPSAIADNAAWDLTSADRPYYQGYVDVGSPADTGATLFCQSDNPAHQVKTGATGLWCYIVTNGGFTPAGNSETYRPELGATKF
jgi:hypothetical protein